MMTFPQTPEATISVSEFVVFALVLLHFIYHLIHSWCSQDVAFPSSVHLSESHQDFSQAMQGDTLVEESVVHEHQFWKRSKTTQYLLYVLTAVGAIVGYWFDVYFWFVFPFMTTLSIYVCDQEISIASHKLKTRWHAICYLFILSTIFFVAEVFRTACGEWKSVARWFCMTLLGLLGVITGTVPGKPRHVATHSKVLELAREDDELSHDEEDTMTSMDIAPTRSASNSILGSLFFMHVMPLVRQAMWKGVVSSVDVPVMGRNMQSETLGLRVRALFLQYVHGADPKTAVPSEQEAKKTLFSRQSRELLYVLVRANTSLFFTLVSMTILSVGMYYAPAFLANQIFTVVGDQRAGMETSRETFFRALPWVLALFLLIIVSSTVQGVLWSCLEGDLAVRLSTQLSTLLYAKTLRRRQEADLKGEGKGSNQVINLHLVDLQRVVSVTFHLFAAITTPLELVVGGYFAYRVLGISALVGLSTTILLMPFIGLLSGLFGRTNERLMTVRDKRMGLLNECFSGIRMIKSQAWESVFQERVDDTRRAELRHQLMSFVCEAVLTCILELNPLLVTLVAFTCYTQVMHQELTPAVAFTSLAIFAELRWTLIMLPKAVTDFVQTLVSSERIATYLISPEVTTAPPFSGTNDGSSHLVRLDHATIAWPQVGKVPTFSLQDVTLDFPTGKTLICGRVGSGKSLLLQSLLYETEVLHGTVQCPRSPQTGIPSNEDDLREAAEALNTPGWLRTDLVAYAPQTPFLMNASIRENILFGLPLGDGKRYQATLEACSLAPDLKQMEHGDLTQVGENGTELSGGQKARIGLARAVYSRARTLLLDDVLSAVDTGTAKHMAERVFAGRLLQGRVVLLVSHNVPLLGKLMDQVVYLDDRHVTFHGTPKQFFGSEHYTGWLDGEKDGEAQQDDETHAHQPAELSAIGSKRGPEHREKGNIAWKVWHAYILASSGWTLSLLTTFLFTLSNMWDLVTNAWLRDWTSAPANLHSSEWWLWRYAGLLGIGIGLSIVRWIGIYAMSLKASQVMFSRMLERTLHAPLQFFDKVTRGRLLNRFGQDLNVLDSNFARAIADVVIRVTQLLATLVALFMVGGVGIVVALLALMPLYGFVAQHYLSVARDLQRLTSTSRSMVVNSFSHAVHGVQVIRAFGAQARFTNEMLHVLDNNNRFVWWTSQGSRWVTQMYNLISSFLVLASCVLILLQPNTEPASIDFSLTFLIQLNFILLILMRMYTSLQTNGVAIERIFEYAENIDTEAPSHMERAPPDTWPNHGHVQVDHLTVRYADDTPNVLHDVSFHVPGGTKLAIVGPTGSGKSTLVGALLRLLEAHKGSIQIDGWDISEVGLHDLRSRVRIVAQDPVILSGTLRSALDVMNQFDDEQVLDCLRRVQLITDGSDAFTDLSMPIAEHGANLSQGQRQLLCLARAILHKARVVLFDEASSSIDYTTDMHITDVIREAFHDSTVLTIAHRLRTVIEYDQVLVLDHGRVKEMGEPAKLLQDPSSFFYRLCKDAGPAEFKYLVAMAGKAADVRQTTTFSSS